MAVLDVRKDVTHEIAEIVFADKAGEYNEPINYCLCCHGDGVVMLYDGLEQKVLVESAEDAQNLIKALNKAIELGWLK